MFWLRNFSLIFVVEKAMIKGRLESVERMKKNSFKHCLQVDLFLGYLVSSVAMC